MQNELAVQVSRKLGAMVCAVHGHRYFYPDGMYVAWRAHSCVRCGQWDQPLESLPYRPEGEGDDLFDYFDEEREQQIERERDQAKRWFAPLSWPRWL